MSDQQNTPLILAPAGTRASFMAALAAGADAVYCGLKSFSARMEAKNFDLNEMVNLVELAHSKDVRVFLTLNTMLKPDEERVMRKLLTALAEFVNPDALIIQDLGMVQLARQAGYTGELHLSTLANVTFPAVLPWVRADLGVDQVVLPRELNIDEIRAMAAATPDGLGLEIFVHGALCYAVSGRCYWSSYLGGKSGLRGRCVQPCRRMYAVDGEQKRYFSCQDFSVDVLTKVLKEIPQIKAWKIEGRKKGPHYVYYVTSAYKLLRDHGHETNAKRDALSLLEMALGRATTHYHLLPQRKQNPIATKGQTGSGLLLGYSKGPLEKAYLVPNASLLNEDMLRVGYEDQPGHTVIRLSRSVPKGGSFVLGGGIQKGTPVFLMDRREQALSRQITVLESELERLAAQFEPVDYQEGRPSMPRPTGRPKGKRGAARDVKVYRQSPKFFKGAAALWLNQFNLEALSPDFYERVWWWLPPVIWPEDEAAWRAMLETLLRHNVQRFMLNAVWQKALFNDNPRLQLWAGPFCNVANVSHLCMLQTLGFAGAVVAPELDAASQLALPKLSPLPMGVVNAGNWPLCVSRVLAEDAPLNTALESPKQEIFWTARYESGYWLFPNWKLDLTQFNVELNSAGYSFFFQMEEPVPKGVEMKKRPGIWNWNVGLS